MKITRRQLRRIIKEELSESGPIGARMSEQWKCPAPVEVCRLLTDDERTNLGAVNSNYALVGNDAGEWEIIDTGRRAVRGTGVVAQFYKDEASGEWRRAQ